MPSVQKMGDVNSGGGIITQVPQSSVYVDNVLICVTGSKGTGHPPCPDVQIHCAGNWQTTSNAFGVYINGKCVNVSGDVDTCGHTRVGGSSSVFVG